MNIATGTETLFLHPLYSGISVVLESTGDIEKKPNLEASSFLWPAAC